MYCSFFTRSACGLLQFDIITMHPFPSFFNGFPYCLGDYCYTRSFIGLLYPYLGSKTVQGHQRRNMGSGSGLDNRHIYSSDWNLNRTACRRFHRGNHKSTEYAYRFSIGNRRFHRFFSRYFYEVGYMRNNDFLFY